MSQANLFGSGIHIAKPLCVPAAGAEQRDRAAQVYVHSLRGVAAGTTIAMALNMAMLMAGGAAGTGNAWWLASCAVSMFVGGVAAARVAGFGRQTDQVWRGLFVWGLATLAGSVMIALPAGDMFGGAMAPLAGELAASAMFEVDGMVAPGGSLGAATLWTLSAAVSARRRRSPAQDSQRGRGNRQIRTLILDAPPRFGTTNVPTPARGRASSRQPRFGARPGPGRTTMGLT